MAEVSVVLDPFGNVTWTPPADKNSIAKHYARAAIEAGASLDKSETSYILALRRDGVDPTTAEAAGACFSDAWVAAEAEAIGDEARDAKAADREVIRMVCTGIEGKHPIEARRALVAAELQRRGHKSALAHEWAIEAIPDPDEGTDPADDGVVLGADLPDTPVAPLVARALAFAGKVGFIHGQKATGKTTVLACAAAAVTRGDDFAGAPTQGGFVLVVKDDDPGSWNMRMQQFGADPLQWGAVPARVATKPGRLAALIEKYNPAWVIVDNLSKWCRALDADVDSSGPAQMAVDILTAAVRDATCPPAMTVAHNEARATTGGYSGRMRNSTVFEDAADWIVACKFDGSRTTTIRHGEKARVGINTETIAIEVQDNGDTFGGPPLDPSGGGEHAAEKRYGKRDVAHAAEWQASHPNGSQRSYINFAKTAGIRLSHMDLREVFKVARQSVTCDAPPRGGITLSRARANRACRVTVLHTSTDRDGVDLEGA